MAFAEPYPQYESEEIMGDGRDKQGRADAQQYSLVMGGHDDDIEHDRGERKFRQHDFHPVCRAVCTVDQHLGERDNRDSPEYKHKAGMKGFYYLCEWHKDQREAAMKQSAESIMRFAALPNQSTLRRVSCCRSVLHLPARKSC